MTRRTFPALASIAGLCAVWLAGHGAVAQSTTSYNGEVYSTMAPTDGPASDTGPHDRHHCGRPPHPPNGDHGPPPEPPQQGAPDDRDMGAGHDGPPRPPGGFGHRPPWDCPPPPGGPGGQDRNPHD
ncbi:hypothetical protein [Tanticharoenia sakaeratensis]|uniref:hypothetical protein n=1 Tax=Tanticharoenia sakaeratensis TaxID=444053 RepID=UPI0011DCAFA2|nr:hypothetical protein [Tanticharoenia sakaeratensis]